MAGAQDGARSGSVDRAGKPAAEARRPGPMDRRRCWETGWTSRSRPTWSASRSTPCSWSASPWPAITCTRWSSASSAARCWTVPWPPSPPSRTWTRAPSRPSMIPAAGSFAPEPGDDDHLGPELRRGRPVPRPIRPRLAAMAPELARLDVRRATEIVVPTADDAGPDRLDQGERGRARRRRRGGRRPDRRRDPPPAGAGADPGRSGRSTPRAACRPSGSG